MDKQERIVLERKAGTELERLLGDGNTPQKIAKRARIVIMTADGAGVIHACGRGLEDHRLALAGVFRRDRRGRARQGPLQATWPKAARCCHIQWGWPFIGGKWCIIPQLPPRWLPRGEQLRGADGRQVPGCRCD